MKDCPPDKILNPATQRCVSKTGAIGKKLMASVIMEVKVNKNKPKVVVDCPPDKILNPVTNKCVSKTGAIGKKLMEKEVKSDDNKAKVRELYGIPNKNKLSSLMKDTFKLFPFDHSFDKEQVRKFINACEPGVRDIAQKIINNTTHISFEKFLARMNTCIYNLMTIVDVNRPVFVYLGKDYSMDALKKKSNYWLYLYVKEFIRFITNDKKEIDLITDFNSPSLHTDDVIVLIDDCIYSGQQMGSTVGQINIYNKKVYKFYLLVPYISNKGLSRIKSNFRNNLSLKSSTLIAPKIQFKLTSTTSILSPEEIDKIKHYYRYWGVSFSNKYLIYFDHKLADSLSTIPHFYLVIVTSNKNLELIKKNILEKNKLMNDEKYKKLAIKLDVFSYINIIPLFKNCKHYTSRLSPESPKCPAPPYKDTFKEFVNKLKMEKKHKSFSLEKKKNNKKPNSF